MTPKQGLPEYECEWCGGFFKYVRLMNGHEYHAEKYTVQKIDADALAGDHPDGEVVAIPPAQAAGRLDCARRKVPGIPAARYSYTLHSKTCPDRHKWTGVKKWVNTIRNRDTIPGPELDHAVAIAEKRGVPFVS